MSFIDRKETVEILNELVKINSINPGLDPNGPGEDEISQYIHNYLESLGLKSKIVQVQPKRSCVLATLQGTGEGKTLFLEGHTDTVGIESMSIDPFYPEIKEGNLYGRGSYDMKSGIAAMLSAIKATVDSGDNIKGDVIFAGVCDEELGQIGIRQLLPMINADSAIVGEPTDLRIQLGVRGAVAYNIKVNGKAAHTARYDIGVDSIFNMSKVLAKLDEINAKLEKAPHHLLGPGSIHASLIKGGQGLSSYPQECEATVIRWIVPGETKETAESEIQSVLDYYSEIDPKFDGDFTTLLALSSMEISEEEPIVQFMKEIVDQVTGKVPPVYGGWHWDETELIHNHGIPTIAFGATGGGSHSAVEWCDLDSLVQTAQIYESMINQFCGVV